MLREITVRNLALLKELSVEFGEGLNVLTGATGAGKSILVGAIDFLLGAKAGLHLIRQGESSAAVEGIFDLSSRPELVAKLEDMGFAIEDQQLILKRHLSTQGDSKAYAGGSRLTLSQLKSIGDLLVDLHGQHDHQSLLNPAQHRELLDAYGQLVPLRDRMGQEYQRLKSLRQDQEQLAGAIQQRRERRELYEFQLRDIQSVDPKEGEDEELERERRILENVEELFAGVSSAYEALLEEEGSVLSRLSAVRQSLEKLSQADMALTENSRACADVIYQLEDLSSSLRQYTQSLSRDPQRLSEVKDRLEELERLRRKYGGTLAAALRRREELSAELATLATGDERLEVLSAAIRQAQETFSRSCQQLSQARAKAALKFRKAVEKELGHLGMGKTRLTVKIDQVEDEDGWAWVSGRTYRAEATGMDQVEFLISPNPGEGMRPLAKIASGGEISRIMLALKTILANADQVPLLIFDEVDVGIGGQVAEAVGQALKALGRTHQVLCITHLHQIAYLAGRHYFVQKEEKRGRTETVIKSLTLEEREQEIARMMGGKEITPLTLEHAREMLRQRKEEQASL